MYTIFFLTALVHLGSCGGIEDEKKNDDIMTLIKNIQKDVSHLMQHMKGQHGRIKRLEEQVHDNRNILMSVLMEIRAQDGKIRDYQVHLKTLVKHDQAQDGKLHEYQVQMESILEHDQRQDDKVHENQLLLSNLSKDMRAQYVNLTEEVHEDIKDIKDEVRRRDLNLTENVSLVNKLLTAEIKKTRQDLNDDITGVLVRINEVNNQTKAVREFQFQLHLDMQYKKIKDVIKISFQDILDLIGEENMIGKSSTVINKLVKQVYDFEQYKWKWGISYADVLRLTDGDVLKGDKDLQTVKKIEKLFEVFEDYNKEWNINFKDVIRLTTKEDMKVIIMTEIPRVLQKIKYLYTEFTTIWRQKWGIQFQDIIDERITKDLNFTVGDKDAPPLKLISSWYVTNFPEIWGDSFKEFFVIMRDHPSNRKSLLEKVTDVSNKGGFLRFLQAKFVYAQEELSVQGYIEVILSNIWGTIWNPKIHFGGDSSAEVLCRQAGYNKEKGVYSNGIYNTGTVSRSLVCLVSQLQCYGQEENVTMCRLNYNTYLNRSVPIKWKHDEDVGIKCTF